MPWGARDGPTGGPVVDNRLMTSVDGVFACGNSLHVHDVVDYVTMEALAAGKNAALYAGGELDKGAAVRIEPGRNVRYTVPQRVLAGNDFDLLFRVREPARDATVRVLADDKVLLEKKMVKVNPPEMVKLIHPPKVRPG